MGVYIECLSSAEYCKTMLCVSRLKRGHVLASRHSPFIVGDGSEAVSETLVAVWITGASLNLNLDRRYVLLEQTHYTLQTSNTAMVNLGISVKHMEKLLYT